MRLTNLLSTVSLGILALNAAPALAQTALPDLPTISDELAPFKDRYDKAKTAQEEADAKLSDAQEKSAKASTAYNKAITASAQFRSQLKQALEEARAAAKAADEAFSKAEDEVQRLRPRRGEDPTQEYRNAEKARSDAQSAASAASSRFDQLKRAYQSQPIDSSPDQLFARAIARTGEKFALDNYTKAEAELIAATTAYANAMLRYPPPYVSELEVTDGQNTYYHGVWVPDPDAPKGDAPNEEELRALETEIKADIAKLSVVLDDHAETRKLLSESMKRDAANISRAAENIGFYGEIAAVAPVIIDSTFFIIDLAVSGGMSTAASRGNILTNVSDEVVTASVTKFFGAIGSADAAAIADTSKLDNFEYGFKGASIIHGDGVELTLSSGASGALASAKKLQNWNAIKNGPAAAGKLLSKEFLDSFKKGAPLAIANSLTKVLADRIFKGALNQAEFEFLLANTRFNVDAVFFNELMQGDREAIAQRKRLQIALAEVQYRLASGGAEYRLVALVDEPIPAKELRDGNLTINATFSQEMSTAPLIAFGDDFLVNWDKIGGFKGTKWRGTQLSGEAFENVDAVTLSVTTLEDPLPFASIDGDPATVVELDFSKAMWRNFEQVPDRSHIVQIDHPLSDLSGIWRRSDGTLFKFTHRGNRLESDYASRPSAFAHEVGDINFNGTVDRLSITGRLRGRPQRIHAGRCDIEFFVDFSFTLSEDRMSLAGRSGNREYNTRDCNYTGRSVINVSYTRVVDENGVPVRELSE